MLRGGGECAFVCIYKCTFSEEACESRNVIFSNPFKGRAVFLNGFINNRLSLTKNVHEGWCSKGISMILRCYQGNKAIFSKTHTHILKHTKTWMHKCGYKLPHGHGKSHIIVSKTVYSPACLDCNCDIKYHHPHKEKAQQWWLNSLSYYSFTTRKKMWVWKLCGLSDLQAVLKICLQLPLCKQPAYFERVLLAQHNGSGTSAPVMSLLSVTLRGVTAIYPCTGL